MRRQLAACVHVIDGVNDAIGRGVSWLTIGMVLGYCLVVLLRYLFGIGSIALQESVTYMHALVFMLAAAYTLNADGHVRVDIFYRSWPARRQLWVNLFGSLFLLLPLAVFLLLASWGYVADSWGRHETSAAPGGLPIVYLLKSIILLLAAQLIGAALARAGDAWLQLTAKECH